MRFVLWGMFYLQGTKRSEEWQIRIAEKSNCSPDKVRYNGCGDLSPECWGSGCKIILCSKANGYNFCYECPEFEKSSCSKYEDLSKDYLNAGVDLRKNSTRIKDGDADEWLKESEELFKCVSCGKPVSAWSVECHRCGGKLK